MKQNPHTRHLRPYLFIFGGVLMLMLLFYLLSRLLHTPQVHPPKSFDSNVTVSEPDLAETASKSGHPFRLMPKAE